MTEVVLARRRPSSLAVGDVLHETWRLYRGFFLRSVVTTLIVFGVLGILAVQGVGARNPLLLWIAFLLPVAGTALVQGALLEAVEDERNHRARTSIGDQLLAARRRLGPLLGVSLLTGLGVGLGLLLLIVPGVILFTRWSLSRSRELVRGHFWPVLRLLLSVGVQTAVATIALRTAFFFLLGESHAKLALWFAGMLASAIATPYTAHALSVVYYRLTAADVPEEPSDTRWTSIWDKA
jgi:hypothetical protein